MNTRIGVRISHEVRDQIQTAVLDGRAKNLSDFVKQAIDEKIQREALAGELFS